MSRLNGKSYNQPVGMWLQKHYCAKCGTTLERERTHRVVTKGDKDYYRYQNRNRYPQRDWDVYDERFRCPGCEARISYEEQSVLAKIQKSQGTRSLTAEQIRENYEAAQNARRKQVLWTGILIAISGLVLCLALYALTPAENGRKDFAVPALLCVAMCAAGLRGVVRHKGQSGFIAGYGYEKEALLQKLHTYSVCNKALVEKADKCRCFHCKTVMDSREITAYAEDGKTAVCPKCGSRSILPDSIEETVDENTLDLMHEYWF